MKSFLNNDKVMVYRGPSIFTNRQGKEDCAVEVSGPWGGMEANGKRYHSVIRIACESGEVLRQYETMPKDITLDWLRQAGYVDAA